MGKQDDNKHDELARSATLHPQPEQVTDELFENNPFFDPRDRLQVKYEMLRRVRVDGHSISHAAQSCGFSRPTYYQALEAFERGGLAALLPEKKGPKRAHKFTPEVLAFIDEALEAEPSIKLDALARRLEEGLGVVIHPKSIARARSQAGKKNAAPRHKGKE